LDQGSPEEQTEEAVNRLVIIRTEASRQIDEAMKKFEKDFPEATEDDRAYVRNELVTAVSKYGHLPDYEIKPNPNHKARGE
jgi:hypothetical protein